MDSYLFFIKFAAGVGLAHALNYIDGHYGRKAWKAAVASVIVGLWALGW